MNQISDALTLGGGTIGVFAIGLLIFLLVRYGALWFQAYFSDARISLLNLIGMSLRGVNASEIVTAKVMAKQAGLDTNVKGGMNTALLEAHALSGGNVLRVLKAIIAAHRTGMDLEFDRAAAIELAGRDVLDAVRTSVSPKVIDCPKREDDAKEYITAIAKDGVELRVRARVTVRTNLDQLIGGATEDTVVARIGQGIIAAIGSANVHTDVLKMPDRISKNLVSAGLDSNTAFEIVSIDIADISVGNNIGARLQSDQAEAATRMAQAAAESHRASAVALEQEMKAKVAHSRAKLILAEATIPAAIADAFRIGQLKSNRDATRLRIVS